WRTSASSRPRTSSCAPSTATRLRAAFRWVATRRSARSWAATPRPRSSPGRSRAAPSRLTVVVDPGAAVVELDETNNQAALPLTTQEGDLFASEPFISPNGDGVRDETSLVFDL